MKSAARLVEGGMIPSAVARELGISASSVKKAVSRYGVFIPESRFGRKFKFPADLVKLAEKLKLSGMYAAEIVLEINENSIYEVSKSQVAYLTRNVTRCPKSKITDSKVLKLRDKRINPNAERDSRICVKYDNGLSLREIAAVFNLSHERIRQIVNWKR